MKPHAEQPPLSWEELRTLHYLWKCQRDLVCEGLTWSIYGKYRLVVGLATVESLTKRGFVRPTGNYDNPAHDDYTLTPFGQQRAVDSEGDFLSQLEERFDQELNRKEIPAPGVSPHLGIPAPEVIESSRRRRGQKGRWTKP